MGVGRRGIVEKGNSKAGKSNSDKKGDEQGAEQENFSETEVKDNGNVCLRVFVSSLRLILFF